MRWKPTICTWGIIICFFTSCIKDDTSHCPQGISLVFECIHPGYLFKEITDNLELLLYTSDGKLAYNYRFTSADLNITGWRIELADQVPASYTLISLVNYHSELISVSGRQNINTLLEEIDSDNNRHISYNLPDTYYGQYTLDEEFFYRDGEHLVMLSKNTNEINLVIEFADKQDFESVTELESYIYGYNAVYQWDNTAPEQQMVVYEPIESKIDEMDRTFTCRSEIMRIWTTADLTLEVRIVSNRVYRYIIDIPYALAQVEIDGRHPYDTDEELEYYDEFTFELVFDTGYVIAGIKINGWYVILQNIEV